MSGCVETLNLCQRLLIVCRKIRFNMVKSLNFTSDAHIFGKWIFLLCKETHWLPIAQNSCILSVLVCSWNSGRHVLGTDK